MLILTILLMIYFIGCMVTFNTLMHTFYNEKPIHAILPSLLWPVALVVMWIASGE